MSDNRLKFKKPELKDMVMAASVHEFLHEWAFQKQCKWEMVVAFHLPSLVFLVTNACIYQAFIGSKRIHQSKAVLGAAC